MKKDPTTENTFNNTKKINTMKNHNKKRIFIEGYFFHLNLFFELNTRR